MTEPSTAVFLSYASQDAGAAQRICEALRGGGVEVWLDTAELRGGDAWDQKIRRQIRDCALFIPIISRNTASRLEGYFRLEWKLAVDRSHLMAAEKPFLLPIVIDGTQDANAHVPDKFREVQWTRLTNGDASPAFVERVTRLLGQSPPAPPATGAAPSAAAPPSAAAAHSAGSEQSSSTVTQPPSRVSWHRALLVSIPLGLVAIGYFALHRAAPPPPTPTPPAESPSSTRPSVQAGSPTQAPQKSVAVLPFVDMSEKHDQEYFSDGLSEELIDVLIKVPGLRVPARTSSFSFKAKAVTVGEIARVLGVTHVLEGSVRKAGGRLRVTAQLIRADDGFHEWSETYDRDVHDVFAVQDDIARSVAEQLKLTLMSGISPAVARDVSPEAHNLYLQARYRMESEAPADLDAAVDLYQRAIAAAPRYAAP